MQGRIHVLWMLLFTCVCAFRLFEVSCVQLRLWHQMGVQQALEEQAWPEVGGERRRSQVGGTFKSMVSIVPFLNADDKPGKPSAVPQSSGFSGWETWKSFQTLSHIWGVPLGESQATHVTSYSGLCLGWFLNVCVGLVDIFTSVIANSEFQKWHLKAECTQGISWQSSPRGQGRAHLLLLGPPLLPPEACASTRHLCFPLRCWNQFPDWII